VTLSIKLPTAFAPLGEAAPLLAHLAGEFAPRIAGLWPAPHAPFLTLPAERRHLIFLAFSVSPDRATNVDLEALLALPLKRAAGFAVSEPPAGLVRALARIGEVAWPAADYRLLIRCLAARQAGKRLRHAEAIEVALVRSLAALPDRLIAGRASRIDLKPAAIRLIVEAEALIRGREGDAAAEAALARWADCATAEALFEQVRFDAMPELPAPELAGTARLVPIRTKTALREAGRRFRNCLGNMILHASSGRTIYFVWRGEPGAVIDVSRDTLFGWRFDEARLARNAAVPLAMREAILRELRSMGVHVGSTAWAFNAALNRAGAGHAPALTDEADLAEAFGD
jgi:hypothetical protein